MMSRKDYIAIAQAFSAELSAFEQDNSDHLFMRLVEAVGRVFLRDNPRFDYERFRAACTARRVKNEK